MTKKKKLIPIISNAQQIVLKHHINDDNLDLYLPWLLFCSKSILIAIILSMQEQLSESLDLLVTWHIVMTMIKLLEKSLIPQ